MTKDTKTLLYVLGGATVLGIGGVVIYNAVKKPPAVEGNGSTAKMPSGDGSAAADATAKAAAEAAAVQAAIDAAVKKIADAAAAAARNAAFTSVKSAFATKHDAEGGNWSSAEVDKIAFIAGIQAAQAAGVAPEEVLGMVWAAAVDFFTSRGYGQRPAEGFATAAQLNAGFGQHQGGGGGMNLFQGNV